MPRTCIISFVPVSRLKKIHNTGQNCSENRRADSDGGCLLQLPLGKVVRNLQLRNTACSPNHAQRALLQRQQQEQSLVQQKQNISHYIKETKCKNTTLGHIKHLKGDICIQKARPVDILAFVSQLRAQGLDFINRLVNVEVRKWKAVRGWFIDDIQAISCMLQSSYPPIVFPVDSIIYCKQ